LEVEIEEEINEILSFYSYVWGPKMTGIVGGKLSGSYIPKHNIWLYLFKGIHESTFFDFRG
jgi:hypothetical protein